MTFNQKLAKLGNAIREYRGAYRPDTGKWVRPPKPEAAGRLLHWLEQLKVDEPIIALADIQGFKNQDEMRKWISAISPLP